MPIKFTYQCSDGKRRQAAVAKARAKYPGLLEGSSGWYRAISAYMKN